MLIKFWLNNLINYIKTKIKKKNIKLGYIFKRFII